MISLYEAPRLSYSNLEVVQHQHRVSTLQQSHGLEVSHVQHHHDDKQAVFLEIDRTAPPFPRRLSRDEKIFDGPIAYPSDVYGERHDNTSLRARRTVCGVRRRIFWGVIALVTIVLAAVGGGVGAHFATKSTSSADTNRDRPQNEQPTSNTTTTLVEARNLSISALQWVDGEGVSQYRVYYQSLGPDQTRILESAWNSNSQKWTASPIIDENVVEFNTPIAASAGVPHTNTSFDTVKTVFFLQPGGTLMERQSPYKEQADVWGNDNFSGLYSASKASSLLSYWYQNFKTRFQILAVFFQEIGANSLSVARYIEDGTADGLPWERTRHSISIADGSPIAAAPVGDGRDLRIYVGGTDGTMKQYLYDLEYNILKDAQSTTFPLEPHTPLCVTLEDNRNLFSSTTLPECVRTISAAFTPYGVGAFATHLILFASPDRRSLNLVSWNCSSGFVEQQDRIADLLKPNRTYHGLASTPASNLKFTDQTVYVLYSEDGEVSDKEGDSEGERAGPAVKMEEWLVPASGEGVPVREQIQQKGKWKLGGPVPLEET